MEKIKIKNEKEIKYLTTTEELYKEENDNEYYTIMSLILTITFGITSVIDQKCLGLTIIFGIFSIIGEQRRLYFANLLRNKLIKEKEK